MPIKYFWLYIFIVFLDSAGNALKYLAWHEPQFKARSCWFCKANINIVKRQYIIYS